MKYKLLFLIALLMFVVLTGTFLYKSRGLFDEIEAELLSYLESNYNVEIKVARTSFWPINQIVLKDTKINSTEGYYSVSVPEISIYYDLFSFFSTAVSPGSTIDFISLKNPQIEINQVLDADNLGQAPTADKELSDTLSRLYKNAPFEIKVEDGALSYNDRTSDLKLSKLNLLFKVMDKEESRIQLDTSIDINEIHLDNHQFKNLNFADVKIVMGMEKDEWHGNIESDYIDLSSLSLNKYFLKSNQNMSYSKIEGSLKPRIVFRGKGLSLQEYKGVFTLKGGQGELELQNKQVKLPEFLRNLMSVQTLKIQDINSEIVYDSNDELLSTKNMEFEINESLFRLNASLQPLANNDFDLFAHLRSKSLKLDKIDLPGDYNIGGILAFDYTVEGFLSDLNMNLDLSLSEGTVKDFKVGNLVSSIRYYQGNTYLDQLNFILNDTNQVSINGIYNNKEKEYSFDLETLDLDLALINELDFLVNSTNSLPTVSGKAKLSANITGNDLTLEGLNLAGQLEVVNPALDLSSNAVQVPVRQNKLTAFSLYSDFYLSGEKLFFNQGNINSDWGGVSFSGDFGIFKNDLNISIDSDYLNIKGLLANIGSDKLSKFTEDDITGEFMLDGLIKGTLQSPVISINLASEEGSLRTYRYDDFAASLFYEDRQLAINNFNLSYHQAVAKGKALIDFNNGETNLDGNLFVDKFNYDILAGILKQENLIEKSLPLDGDVNLELSILGPISQPDIELQANSADTRIIINNKLLELDNLNMAIVSDIDGFRIDNLELIKGEALLNASGLISSKAYNIDYQLSDFPLQDILEQTDINQVGGMLNLAGGIEGSLKQPLITGELKVEGIKYQQFPMGVINGSLQYFNKQVKLDSLIWKNDQQGYIIDGKINNILSAPNVDIAINIERGQLDDLAFLKINDDFKGLFKDYYLQGETLLTGRISDINTWLDLSIINNTNPDDMIKISGNISDMIDLSLQGSGISINKFVDKYGDTKLSGQLELNGKLSGHIDSIDLSLNTKITAANFEDISFRDVEGRIDISKGDTLSFKQNIQSADGSLKLTGSYPFKEGVKGLNINLNIEEFPLQILSAYNDTLTDISGRVSGDVELNGGLSEPELSGELSLSNAGFDAGLVDSFSNIDGSLLFSGNIIKLSGFTAYYGRGNISVQGLLRPFASMENIDIQLNGENLPFDYGSFHGKFNSDITVNGSFEEPFIKGELLAYDLDVGIPFEWPVSNNAGGNNLKFDLNIDPGENVHLLNENINVLIQNGSLNINNIEGPLVFTGELSSRQGAFNFYNNKFILEEGTAIFERSFDQYNNSYIPEMDINAWTNIGGTRIEVNLSGLADNMITTFTSSPPLDREQILTLLTSKGGLGEFTSGDFANVVQSELYRVLYNQLQLDVVDELQNEIKNIFSLDTLEVDFYNWGWNNQLSIYLGKYLNDRLYLQYTDTIGNNNDDYLSNQQGELSIQYFLNDSVTIETGWQGEDDFSLSIETNIDF